jgi:hypothetical protein
MQKTFWYVEGVGGVGGVWTKTVFKSGFFKTEAEAVKYEKENRLRILLSGAEWIFVRRLTASESMKRNKIMELAVDLTTYMCDMDPYGMRDDMKDEETEAEYIQRNAESIASVDGIRAALDDLYKWNWDSSPEDKEALDGFKARLENLARAC